MKIGGWIGVLTFRDKSRDLLLEWFIVTSHSLAQLVTVSTYMFSNWAVTSGCSTVRNKPVSSAKSQVFARISFTISFIKSKNNNGPNIEHWWHLLLWRSIKIQRWAAHLSVYVCTDQSSSFPEIPAALSLWIRVACQTWSKALLISQKITRSSLQAS